MIATLHMAFWSDVPSLGVVSLGDALGWPRAVVVQLAMFALIAVLAWWLERRRRPTPRRRRRRRTRRVVSGPWPLWVGAVLLALLNVVTLALAGHPWTITWAFSLWGAKALTAVGDDITRIPFWAGDFQQAAVAAPILMDTTSVMDVGLVLGALLGTPVGVRLRELIERSAAPSEASPPPGA